MKFLKYTNVYEEYNDFYINSYLDDFLACNEISLMSEHFSSTFNDLCLNKLDCWFDLYNYFIDFIDPLQTKTFKLKNNLVIKMFKNKLFNISTIALINENWQSLDNFVINYLYTSYKTPIIFSNHIYISFKIFQSLKNIMFYNKKHNHK